MAKPIMGMFAVWVEDSDGSERKYDTVSAVSPGHALSKAKKRGATKVTGVALVEVDPGYKSSVHVTEWSVRKGVII